MNTKKDIAASLREMPAIKRIIPLEEVKTNDWYEDMAELAVIFNHDIVETKDGIWRWRPNRLVNLIRKFCPVYTPCQAIQEFVKFGRLSVDGRASLNLNDLICDVHNGFCSVEEYMKFYMQMGYSLAGYAEVFGQHNAYEFQLPGAKTEHESGQDPDDYVETVIDYMRRIHKEEILKI